MSNSNYKSLFKATGLFGIVEFIRLLLRIVVNKFASLYLGPAGVGLLGLIENTVQLIISFTSFGINFTGVREIAVNRLSSEGSLRASIKLVNLFAVTTGLLAAVISILFSNYLSKETFGSDKYTIWFVLLAIYFICTSFVQSKTILLEGLQNIKKLILLNIASNITNAVIIIGCYYYYHTNGIIISMILTSIVNFLIFWRGSIKYSTRKINVPPQEIKSKFKYFAKSGGLLAINSCIGLLGYYLIRQHLKPIEDGNVLGYYQVSSILMVSYVGIIFIGINKFYFPKLTQTLKEKDEISINNLVNNQLELCFLVLLPAILLLYLIGTTCIELLFSAKFLPVYEILIFGLVSIFIKGFNYTVGYMILSHNNFKQYFYINAVSDILNTILTIALFKFTGLYGIGLAILINYLMSAFYTFYFVRKNYNFRIQKETKKLLVYTSLISLLIIISYFKFDKIYYYILTSVLFIISLIYSTIKLDNYLFDELLINKLKSFLKINCKK